MHSSSVPDLKNRFVRQQALPGFGARGQSALSAARVLVIGAGGLGSSVLPALAAAGIGTLGIIDDDTVETTNLHRQYLHGEGDVGQSKVSSAAASIAALNSQTQVIGHELRLSAANALQIFADYDLVIDGSDNFPTRYLANDAAALTGIPLVWGAVLQYSGQAGVCWAAQGPQYRDLFPTPPPAGSVLSCATGGVLPTVCAVIGAILATETIKMITSIGTPLLGRVTTYNALTGGFRELAYDRDPAAEPITELIDYDLFCGVTPAGASAGASGDTVSAAALAAELEAGAAESTALTGGSSAGTGPRAGAARLTLLDVREPWEVEVAALPGAVVIPLGSLEAALERGTTDLDPEAPLVVFCHHGIRSATALDLLITHGFGTARHLEGGIDAWASTVDPALARY